MPDLLQSMNKLVRRETERGGVKNAGCVTMLTSGVNDRWVDVMLAAYASTAPMKLVGRQNAGC